MQRGDSNPWTQRVSGNVPDGNGEGHSGKVYGVSNEPWASSILLKKKEQVNLSNACYYHVSPGPLPQAHWPLGCPHMPTVLCWDLCLSYKLCFKWGPHIQLQGPASNPSTDSSCLLSQEGSLTPPLEGTIPSLQAAHVLLCCTGIILNFVCVVHLCSSVYLEGTQYGFDD